MRTLLAQCTRELYTKRSTSIRFIMIKFVKEKSCLLCVSSVCALLFHCHKDHTNRQFTCSSNRSAKKQDTAKKQTTKTVIELAANLVSHTGLCETHCVVALIEKENPRRKKNINIKERENCDRHCFDRLANSDRFSPN